MLEFMFKDQGELNRESLFQGDIIAKSADVVERIGIAHQYYASAEKYSHFAVITQSCDLVRRGGEFKAPYITIAAAKPFRLVVEGFIENNLRAISNSEFRFLNGNSIQKFKDLLERHLNNTEPDYFFIPKGENTGIGEDIIVFLRLTIALKKEHYEALAAAKVAEIEDVFQAKLGWLVGNIYSRVATPDIEEKSPDAKKLKSDFYDKYYPKDSAISLSTLQADILRDIVRRKRKEIGRDLTKQEVQEIISSEIDDDMSIISSLITNRLINSKVIDGGDESIVQKARNAIANEPRLRTIVKARVD